MPIQQMIDPSCRTRSIQSVKSLQYYVLYFFRTCEFSRCSRGNSFEPFGECSFLLLATKTRIDEKQCTRRGLAAKYIVSGVGACVVPWKSELWYLICIYFIFRNFLFLSATMLSTTTRRRLWQTIDGGGQDVMEIRMSIVDVRPFAM